ncbi:hypothetical protein Q4Q34_12245 [Flavivirga abyssicola]|uniref:tetratricopeptide repeat protein n=1 Tax=Flavivirga abyssicola TaxID=3063533 RepID=UPI0026E10F7B|nr:hypothetical protein [Flavivirga sp. MEBiC07777]WVK11994.1 hypothetical protein Q4Q34_12245 [Flavivirga sp. MEBiC07777]
MKFYFLNVLFVFLSFFNGYAQSFETLTNEQIKEKALKLKFINPDSAVYFFDKGYQKNLKSKDTLQAIDFLIELSSVYAHTVNYVKSYDGYWEALLLADMSKDSISKPKIYEGLGWLYSFYKRDSESLKYINLALKLNKELSKNNKDVDSEILSNYFSLLNFYRVREDYKMAKIYLDSCYQVKTKWRKNFYLEVESGYLDAIDGNYDQAIRKIKEAKSFFEISDRSYLMIVHALLGDIYARMDKINLSIFHNKKSLQLSEELKSHSNYKLKVYKSLSELYQHNGNISEAYKYLKKEKALNDAVFGGKSVNNQYLLGIKDKYRLEKDKQENVLKQQRITQLEQEEKIYFLQRIILFVIIVFLVLFGYLFVRYIRNKHKIEKKILKEKQKLKLQKQNEILELKNKELTESALRLIEKDEFISSIKKELSHQAEGLVDVNAIKRLLRSVQGTPDSNWKEFEARFTSINQKFYKKLKKLYPNLSATDQKICALVKLNFPSKGMAKLLGISVESVHTSRYRLRKKLGLQRNQNLEEVINKI